MVRFVACLSAASDHVSMSPQTRWSLGVLIPKQTRAPSCCQHKRFMFLSNEAVLASEVDGRIKCGLFSGQRVLCSELVQAATCLSWLRQSMFSVRLCAFLVQAAMGLSWHQKFMVLSKRELYWVSMGRVLWQRKQLIATLQAAAVQLAEQTQGEPSMCLHHPGPLRTQAIPACPVTLSPHCHSCLSPACACQQCMRNSKPVTLFLASNGMLPMQPMPMAPGLIVPGVQLPARATVSAEDLYDHPFSGVICLLHCTECYCMPCCKTI